MILARDTDDPDRNHFSGVQGTHADRCESESQREVKKQKHPKKPETVSTNNFCNEFCWKKEQKYSGVVEIHLGTRKILF